MACTFVARHEADIAGVVSCFDRVVLTGSLPDIGHARVMEGWLRVHGVRLADYPRWAEPMREEIRDNAMKIAAAAGLEIEFIRKLKAFRKEDRVKRILDVRGDAPGLVHIFSAMEACTSFRHWRDPKSGITTLRPTSGKCLHYYFYFIDERFGLCYVRVPTWAPFRLQVYFNGHNWLARRLRAAGIGFQLADNAFLAIDDFERAQALAGDFDIRVLHRRLEHWAQRFCPAARHFPAGHHWSIMQAEYATDILFRRQDRFQPLYDAMTRTAVHSVKADQVATFLGRKLTKAYAGEAGNDFSTRIHGTRIRHAMGPASIKLYDKFGIIARVECTTNDPSFFKLHRDVKQRDGTSVFKLAPLRKSIYSLRDLATCMANANQRYLAFLATIDNPWTSWKDIDRIGRPTRDKKRSLRGFNLMTDSDLKLFLVLARPEWTISGLRAANLRQHLPHCSAAQISRLLKRLRAHGLIKKVGRTYKYYLTRLGQRAIVAVLHLRETILLKGLAPVSR